MQIAKLRILGLLAIGLSGCGGAANAKPLPPTVPVSGTITLNGEPLAFAAVTFIPGVQTKGIECTGLTDEYGNYTLKQMRGAEGAPPGEYQVVIRCPKSMDGTPALKPPPSGTKADEVMGVAAESLPPQYSDPAQTRLTNVVPKEGGTLDFDLKAVMKTN